MVETDCYRMIEKMTKKRDEVIASGKPYKGEIKGVKLGKGSAIYLEYINSNFDGEYKNFEKLTSIR